MQQRVRKLVYDRYQKGWSLKEVTEWLDETGYKKKTKKDKPAEVVDLLPHLTHTPFPM